MLEDLREEKKQRKGGKKERKDAGRDGETKRQNQKFSTTRKYFMIIYNRTEDHSERVSVSMKIKPLY
jgi:hypothetical protein